ncbi:hypothetical protein, partial [Gemmiger qucibialis]|uniref:hypothetical protein n=1 Tax=Gemmiger qucibialis TaxID=2997294 RepID=UPI0022E10528
RPRNAPPGRFWGAAWRIFPAAPNHENPNLFSIGEEFGLFVFRLLRNHLFPQRGEAQTDIQAKMPTEE